MNLNIFEYLCDTKHVGEQEESVPFLGDAFCIENEEFYAVDKKKFNVNNVEITETGLTVDVAVAVDLKSIPARFDGIVVGVHGLNKSMEIRWQINELSSHSHDIPFDIEVEPGQTLIRKYLIQPIKRFAAYKASSQTLQLQTFLNKVGELSFETSEIASGIAAAQDVELIGRCGSFVLEMGDAVKEHISKILSPLSSDNWVKMTVILIKQQSCLLEMVSVVEPELGSLKTRYKEKQQAVSLFIDKGVEYVSSDEDWADVLQKYDVVYALMFYERLLFSSTKAYKFFFEYMSKDEDIDDAYYCVVDLDLVSPEKMLGKPPRETVVRKYERSRCITEDLQRTVNESRKSIVCWQTEGDPRVPERRALLEIPCPGFYRESCPGTKQKWLCQKCQSQLYFGFHDNIHCDRCGTVSLRDCEFRCDFVGHQNFLRLANGMRDELQKLRPMEERNILILGQSGVGKSTWINSIVNYMTFRTLETAERHDVMAPIPSRFILTDDFLRAKTVLAGIASDEVELGQSVTQDCNKYSVLFDNMVINLIDTPGLGDSRGVEEDKANINKILNHLRFVPLIHGICLLLKPNETRISILLSYCLKEILSNLHQSSSQNLIFCFTNARSTFYKPGETMPLLTKLLSEIGVTFAMKDRTFCLDNEAFKYLCCKNTAGITFSKNEHDSFSMSWDKSVEETTALLKRVSLLDPHRTSDTWSLNRARRIILSLTRPIGEITMLIQDNIAQYELKRADLENTKKTLKQLQQYAYVPQLILEARELGYPRTVCTAEKCIKYHTFPKSQGRQVEYISHCHQHCYLTGVQAEQFPNRLLLGCWAMSGEHCRICSCSWETHMHILYDQMIREVEMRDAKIEADIANASDESAAKAAVMNRLEATMQEHESEKAAIIRQCVKFAHFLRNNAIAGYNDALGDYLRFLIEKEEAKSNKTNMETEKIEKMKETRNMYEEEVQIFRDAAMQGRRNVTPEDIAEAEQELYNLPIYGAQLQQNMTVALAAEDAAARYTGTVAKAKPKSGKQSGKSNDKNVKGNIFKRFVDKMF